MGFLYSGAVQDQDGPVHQVQGVGDIAETLQRFRDQPAVYAPPTVGTARHNDEST